MRAAIFIEPHERHDALEAYTDCLTAAQVEEIEEAPESALIKLDVDLSARTCSLLIIPEG